MLAELKFTIIINNWWVKHTKSVADVATQVYGSWIMSFYSRSREMWLLIATFSVEAYQMSFWLWAWKLPEFWSEISIVSKFEHWTSPWNVWWIGKKYEIILKVSTNESKCLKHPWSRPWKCFQVNFSTLNCSPVCKYFPSSLFFSISSFVSARFQFTFFIQFVRQCSSSHSTLIYSKKKVEVACVFL